MKVRYWLRIGLQMLGIACLASLVYGILMGDRHDWQKTVRLCGIYFIGLGVILCMLMTFMLHKQHIPVAVSLGATRREAFWDMQLCRGGYSLLQTLLATALIAVSSEKFTWRWLYVFPLLLALSLVLHGASGLLAAVYAKLGSMWAVITGVVELALGIVGMVLFITASDGNRLPPFGAGIAFSVLAVALAGYLAVSVLEFQAVRKLTVKL